MLQKNSHMLFSLFWARHIFKLLIIVVVHHLGAVEPGWTTVVTVLYLGLRPSTSTNKTTRNRLGARKTWGFSYRMWLECVYIYISYHDISELAYTSKIRWPNALHFLNISVSWSCSRLFRPMNTSCNDVLSHIMIIHVDKCRYQSELKHVCVAFPYH